MLAVVPGVTAHGTPTTNQVNLQIGTLVRAGMNQAPTNLGNHKDHGGVNKTTTGKPQTNGIEGIERETNIIVQTLSEWGHRYRPRPVFTIATNSVQ